MEMEEGNSNTPPQKPGRDKSSASESSSESPKTKNTVAEAIAIFAVWLVPFSISTFSERHLFPPSNILMHEILRYSLPFALVCYCLVLVLFFKFFRHEKIRRIFAFAFVIDLSLAKTFNNMWWMIDGEYREIYEAFAWLPFFKFWGITPDYSWLYWVSRKTGLFFEMMPIVLAALFVRSSSVEEASPKGILQKLKSFFSRPVLVIAACCLFLVFSSPIMNFFAPKNSDRYFAKLDHSVLEREYREIPDSASVERAKYFIKVTEYGKALDLYRRGAEIGDSNAILGLAGMYKHGMGVSKDEKKAYFLTLKATEKGNLKALVALAWYFKGEDRINTYARAADCGDVGAMRFAGRDYLDPRGMGNAPNYIKGVHYYRLSAEKGDIDGMAETAGACYRGYMTPLNLDEAAHWAGRVKEWSLGNNDGKNSKDARTYDEQMDLLLARIEKKRARMSRAE